MGGTGTNMLALLKNPGLGKLLESMAGLGNRPPAQQQTGPQVPQVQAPTPPPMGNPLQAQGQAPQQSQAAAGTQQGTMPMPVPRQPTMGGPPPNDPTTASKLDPKAAAMYSGIQGVSQVLHQWNEKKDAKESAEAANIAQNLMQAMQNNDVATVHEILNDKHSTKVLQKVYKGWLTKSQDQQKQQAEAGKAQKPPDPTVQGFEQGLQKYLQGGGPQPDMPKQMGGFQLPQAGPVQQTQAIAQQAALQKAKDDPKSTLPSQLTSDEQRQAQLGKEGLVLNPRDQEKYEAAKQKWQADTVAAMSKAQAAAAEVKKEELQLQIKQVDMKNAQLKGQQVQTLEDTKLQTARVNQDIAMQRLKLLQVKTQYAASGPKPKQPPATLIKQMEASSQAQTYVESVLNSRGDKGFTQADVQMLQAMLKQAGAVSLAQSLPGWMGIHMNSWLGGSGMKDVQSMLDGIKQYKTGVDNTIHDINPAWAPKGSVRDAEKDIAEGSSDEGPGEGDTDEPEADIVVSPEDMKPNE